VPLPLLTILIDEQECKYMKDTTRIYVTHHCGILHVFTFLLIHSTYITYIVFTLQCNRHICFQCAVHSKPITTDWAVWPIRAE